MKYTGEIKHQIDDLRKAGWSGRAIATYLGLSKSGVNQYLSDNPPDQPKILFYDTETAPTIAAVFGMYDINITQDNVIQQGDWLISASWKWAHKDNVESISVTPKEAIRADDRRVVSKLRDEFEKADFVVAHHGDGFDGPVFRTRLLMNDLPPHKPVRSIDTKKMAKKLFFRSNKLETLGQRLTGEGKVKHDGINLWIRCMQGDLNALTTMVLYNRKDVGLLEDVYYEMLPYDNTAPAMNAYYLDNKPRCARCGSEHVVKHGSSYKTNLAEYSLYQCGDCGAFSRDRTNKLTKDKKKSILLSV